MAFEYFLYRTDYNNTLVDRGATSFAPLPPNTGEIFIEFPIPQNQPLYFYKESAGNILLNDESTIEAYLNEVDVETSDSNVTYGQLTGYTATTSTGISNVVFTAYTASTNTRLNGIENDVDFVSGVTASKVDTSAFNIYSANTLTLINGKIGTANNGLNKIGTNVRLGGLLTGTTNIGLNTFNLNITGASGQLIVGSSRFSILNPANTFRYNFVGSAIAANRDITIPLLTGSDTLVTAAFAQTLTNKTLTTPTLTTPRFATNGFIADSSGNEQLIFTLTASAVNEFRITNAATNNNPIFGASGGDANVGIDFLAKGNGVYRFLGTATKSAEIRLLENTTGGTNYIALRTPTSIAANATYSLPNVLPVSNGQVLSSLTDGTMSWASVASLSIITGYTATTEIRLSGIEGDINYISGVTTSKLDTTAFNGYSATTNTRLNGIESNITYISGITNSKLSISAFNSYSAATLTNINSRVLSSIFNTYTGVTAPATYQSKSSIVTLTGTTLPNTYQSKSSIVTLTGTTLPNQYAAKSAFLLFTGTTAPATYLTKVAFNTYTGSTSGIVTANNGLTKNGNNVSLGGDLTGVTTLEATSHDFTLTGSSGILTLGRNTGLINISSRNAINIVGKNVSGVNRVQFRVTSTGATLSDANSTGIQYTANYSAGFTPRSLVDKGYVTGLTTVLLATANNGITKAGTSQNIHLGGALTGATVITSPATGSRLSFAGFPIQYSVDLSANYNVRSLVDRGYVTGITNTLIATANNGITKGGTSQNVHLGGALTGATVITSPATGSRLSFAGFPIQYSTDVSANFNPRSLVDKGYVTGLTSSNVYGTQFQLASDLTSTSTTSVTPVAKVTMNTTSLPAGTYKIIVHWMWQRNSTANSARFNLTIGGVAQGTTATMEMEAGDVTDFRPETRIFYVALSGNNTIVFNHWAETNGNTTTTSDATIELIRVQ